MHGLLKQPGYRLHPPDSPEASALLAEQGFGPADLDRALAHLERVEGTTVGTIVGINEDGVFGTGREGWRPDLPVAVRESASGESGFRLGAVDAADRRPFPERTSRTTKGPSGARVPEGFLASVPHLSSDGFAASFRMQPWRAPLHPHWTL